MPPWRPITDIALSMKGCIKPNGTLHHWMSTKGEAAGDKTTKRLCRAIQDILCDTDEAQLDKAESINIDPSLFNPVDANATSKKSNNTKPMPNQLKFYFNEGNGKNDFIQIDMTCRIRVSDISPGGWNTIKGSGWVSKPGVSLQHVGDPRLCCKKSQDMGTYNTGHQPGQQQERRMDAGSFAEGPWLHGAHDTTESLTKPPTESTARRGRPARGTRSARGARNNRGRGARSSTDSGSRRQEKLETRKNAVASIKPQEAKFEPTIPPSHLYDQSYVPYSNQYVGNHTQQALQNPSLQDTTLPQILEEEELEAVDPMM